MSSRNSTRYNIARVTNTKRPSSSRRLVRTPGGTLQFAYPSESYYSSRVTVNENYAAKLKSPFVALPAGKYQVGVAATRSELNRIASSMTTI